MAATRVESQVSNNVEKIVDKDYAEVKIGNTRLYCCKNFYERYEFIRVLGEGSFSVVKLYKDRKNGELKVLKELKVKNPSKQLFSDVRTEIEIGKKVHSLTLHSPKVYGFFCYMNQFGKLVFVISMEYIEGEAVSDCKNIDIGLMVNWMLWIIDILHKNNITHKDIKEDNIIYDKKNERFMLVDFGLSFYLTQDRTSIIKQLIKGTPFYFSPRMVSLNMNVSEGKINEVSDEEIVNVLKDNDIWAMGVTIYSVSHGKYPYPNIHDLMILFQLIINKNIEIKIESENMLLSKFLKYVLNKNHTLTMESVVKSINDSIAQISDITTDSIVEVSK